MKRNKIIAFFGSLALAATGLVAVSQIKTPINEARAGTSTTVYCAISNSNKGSYTLKLNVNFKGDGDDWHSWNMNSTGKTMTDGTPVYSCTFTDDWNGLGALQFQLYDGGTWKEQEQPISTWTSVGTYNNKCYVYKGGANEWIKPYFSKGRYIVGKFGDGNWDIDHAVFMSKSGDEYTGKVSLAFKDSFKIAYWDGNNFKSDTYEGYQKLTPNAAAYYCFTSTGNPDYNILCYAEGTYNFYFTDKNYDETYKISCAIDGDKTAQQLCAKILSLGEWEGHCGDEDRFPACKTMYLGLSAGEQSKFQGFASETEAQFKNAYDRYYAWAAALGEKPFEDGKVSALALHLFDTNNETTVPTALIVVACVLSLTAVGGYVFYRKRKEN